DSPVPAVCPPAGQTAGMRPDYLYSEICVLPRKSADPGKAGNLSVTFVILAKQSPSLNPNYQYAD
ncbi:MAG: hypothetical protein LBQ35_03270, partial [Spirochaetaceae bacterium]|nr:hypothetical protein [Spirochaetaceae bacterium]